MKHHPCPKCNRNLPQGGEATLTDASGKTIVYAVYSCDECIQIVDFCGEKFEQTLTFALDPSTGRIFDPTEPDGELKF